MVECNVGPVPKACELERSSYEPIKHKLPNSLFAKNRARFCELFQKQVECSAEKKAFGFFKGANPVPLYSSDVDYPEYQEAFFYYLFGVHEMDCYGIMDF